MKIQILTANEILTVVGSCYCLCQTTRRSELFISIGEKYNLFDCDRDCKAEIQDCISVRCW